MSSLSLICTSCIHFLLVHSLPLKSFSFPIFLLSFFPSFFHCVILFWFSLVPFFIHSWTLFKGWHSPSLVLSLKHFDFCSHSCILSLISSQVFLSVICNLLLLCLAHLFAFSVLSHFWNLSIVLSSWAAFKTNTPCITICILTILWKQGLETPGCSSLVRDEADRGMRAMVLHPLWIVFMCHMLRIKLLHSNVDNVRRKEGRTVYYLNNNNVRRMNWEVSEC